MTDLKGLPPLFRRFSEESYLSEESFLSVDEYVDVELYESEIATSLENLSAAFGFVQEARAAAAVVALAEASVTDTIVGGLASLAAPEFVVPILLGAGAYGLYTWLAPKASEGNSPQPVRQPPTVSQVGGKTTTITPGGNVNLPQANPAVVWREVVPAWAPRSRRRRR